MYSRLGKGSTPAELMSKEVESANKRAVGELKICHMLAQKEFLVTYAELLSTIEAQKLGVDYPQPGSQNNDTQVSSTGLLYQMTEQMDNLIIASTQLDENSPQPVSPYADFIHHLQLTEGDIQAIRQDNKCSNLLEEYLESSARVIDKLNQAIVISEAQCGTLRDRLDIMFAAGSEYESPLSGANEYIYTDWESE
ncbi:MAG: hypothetical protein AB8B66_00150 [Rickettsiaceae bacterium]